MRIGVVLQRPPGYSESFLSSLISGLTENDFEIILFVKSDLKYKGLNVSGPYSLSGYYPFDALKVLMVLLYGWIFNFTVTKTYFHLLKKDEIVGIKRIKLYYQNAHILGEKLDWLYFGFATIAIDREQVAHAVGAKMALSIRGYDIAISPLGRTNYYKLTWKYLDKLHYLSKDLLFKAYELGLNRETSAVQITPAIVVENFMRKRDHPINEDLTIITVARLHWKKGLNYALLAMKTMLDRGINFKYTIVGEGNEYEKLCFMIHDLGLKDKVFLIGKKSANQIAELLICNKIFLMPSVQEGFCNSVIEAQAAGCLCVVSDAEGLTENIIDNKTGWVVPRRDEVAIANSIQFINTISEEEIFSITDNAKKRVTERFNLESHLKSWLKFYES